MKLKRVSMFVVMLIALFAVTVSVKAVSNGASISCTPETIKIVGGTSQTAVCTVKVSFSSPVETAAVTLASNEYLIISDVKANSSLWKAASSSTKSGQYAFNSKSGSIPAGEYELFSFDLALDPIVTEKVKDDTANCGQLCISAVTFDGIEKNFDDSANSTTCFAPVVTPEKCTGDNCNSNPSTGAFANYALIGAGIIVAISAIVIARRNNKFFRV